MLDERLRGLPGYESVVVKENGERVVIAASTAEFGPPRYSVTWSALATQAVLVGQFALPLNRLGTMLSTAGKRFTAGGLGRMLRYVMARWGYSPHIASWELCNEIDLVTAFGQHAQQIIDWHKR